MKGLLAGIRLLARPVVCRKNGCLVSAGTNPSPGVDLVCGRQNQCPGNALVPRGAPAAAQHLPSHRGVAGGGSEEGERERWAGPEPAHGPVGALAVRRRGGIGAAGRGGQRRNHLRARLAGKESPHPWGSPALVPCLSLCSRPELVDGRSPLEIKRPERGSVFRHCSQL